LTHGFSFPKSARLLKRSEFLAVQASSHRVAVPGIVFCVLPNGMGHVRIGFTVSRKFGKAVERNRIRRRLREAVRRFMPQLQNLALDIVVLPRQGIDSMSFGKLLDAVGCFVKQQEKPA